LFSKTDAAGLAGLMALALFGCATPAPTLPPDTTSVNRIRPLAGSDFPAALAGMECRAIIGKIVDDTARIKELEEAFASNNANNQVAVYVGLLFFPPALAGAKGQDAERKVYVALQEQQEWLRRLYSFKNCDG
jgi:hypothetical protein